MCGIHGMIALAPGVTVHDPSVLKRMGDVTVHRGPDDSGAYFGEGVALGMRRLSIIDLAGGHQPISNSDDTLWLVCNGEIYNFRELRQTLQAQGHMFKTGSDSEVIIHLYAEYGDAFISQLNGMYDFALWDVKKRRLLIGRDRLGVKPLYYYCDHKRLVFATEAKAILEVPGVNAAIDPVALDAYLALGYVPAPDSMFAGIKKLPPASLMVVENGEYTIQSYWQLPHDTDYSLSEQDWLEAVRQSLDQAVHAQMVSDVPIGAFLSGGIDSSAVVAFMSQHSDEPINTYAIGFGGDKASDYYNELPYAKQVAEQFNTHHKEILVNPDVVTLLPRLLWHMDEPIADTAFITTYLVSEFARHDVKVILSGVGGDELFGGYRRYLGDYYARRYQNLPPWVRTKLIRPVAEHLPSDRHSPLLNLSRYARSFIISADLSSQERYRSYVQVFSQEMREQLQRDVPEQPSDALGAAFAAADGEDALRQLFDVDCRTQLPDDLLLLTDKMTMATSLECRVPLLDHELVELSARIPAAIKISGRNLKHILKRSLEGVLPDSILYRKKRGFGAPMGAWIKRELAPLLKTTLSQESIERRGLFDWDTVHKTMALHEANKEDHTDHLLALLNFEIWARLYIDKQTPADIAGEMSEWVR